jgi:mRNA-degrading endonuclease RelE of RelBE toxin-antitoxin system
MPGTQRSDSAQKPLDISHDSSGLVLDIPGLQLYASTMAAAVTVLDSFLSSAYDLPKEISRKVFKALRNFVTDPQSVGLHMERLHGQTAQLWSIRVDDDYRIIFRESESGPPVVLFVGKHDHAYRFADRMAQNQGPPIGLFAREIPSGIEEIQDVTFSMHMQRELIGEAAAARVDLEDLESMVTTRKYLSLARVLLREDGTSVRFTFAQLEKAIADRLPPSARKHRPWWANERGRHVQASSWLGVGWKVGSVDLTGEIVTFNRIKT